MGQLEHEEYMQTKRSHMSDHGTAHMFKDVKNTFLATILCWLLIATPAIAQTLFAAIGDYGTGTTEEASVAGLVYEWNPDFIITLGDNRYGSMNYDEVVGQYFCNYLADVGNGGFCSGGNSQANMFFPSLGNGDYQDGGGVKEYLNYFTLPGKGVATSGTSGSERYYDFVKGPVHFFVLDSQGARNKTNSTMTAQQNWLQAQLAKSTAQWNIVYFHHPAYSSGTSTPSTVMQWPFAAWGADAVISGHDHIYERIFADGIVYFINGLGGDTIGSFLETPVSGSQVRYNGDYGAMQIDASDTTIEFQFINSKGDIIDEYTIDTNPGTRAYQQDAGTGQVVFEAEHADANISRSGYSWVANFTAKYSGDSALRTSPTSGKAHSAPGYSQTSPQLDYQVNFVQTGTHYVWVRGYADRSSNNSVHVGLDGAEVASSENIYFPVAAAWNWAGGPGVASFVVLSPGVHTVNVWMREPGFRIDKLVVTSNAGITPSGLGPAESPASQ